MTYCVGMLLDDGLVTLADTRTNAGVDHVSTFRKLHVWEVPGDRAMVLMSAGNLSVSQTVVNILNEGIADDEDDEEQAETLLTVGSMFKAAQLVGHAVQNVRETVGKALDAENSGFNASFILGGQIKGRELRLFQIYAEGNFIEATPDTPYFQIGETKYGKPILDRVLKGGTSLTEAVKLALLSMDSTLRSNISVGMPLDLAVYKRDALKFDLRRRIGEEDPYFSNLRALWSKSLQSAAADIPDMDW